MGSGQRSSVSSGRTVALSVVIPAHNEAGSIAEHVGDIVQALGRASVEYEIVVVDDASSDDTEGVVRALAEDEPARPLPPLPQPARFRVRGARGARRLRGRRRRDRHGRRLGRSGGPRPLPPSHRGRYDCAFGSRFIRGSAVHDYPKVKLGAEPGRQLRASGCSSAAATTTRRTRSRRTGARSSTRFSRCSRTTST